jgi:hypothetical protein
MKKPLAILLLLFSYSSLYSQMWGGGVGLGYGKNGGSFQMTGILGSKVFHLAGNIFNGRNEEDTYEFSPSLFDDRDKGKLREAVWVGYGYYQKVGNAAFSLAGGLSISNEFFIREDLTEILADKGTYYVRDDDSTSFMPTLILSTYANVGKTKSDKSQLGMTLNLFPFDFSFVYVFP